MLLYAKGLCIGAVEVLQGISGGTMMLLLGTYEEMVCSLSEIDRQAFQLLRWKKYREFWKKINGSFLSAIGAGIISGWFSLLWIISYLHQYFYIPTNAFFFTLIAVSTLLIIRHIKKLWPGAVLAFVGGAAISFCITLLPPLQSPDNVFTGMISGIISAMSLVIPGVSGTYILILLGKYPYILTGFITLKALVILFFIAGSLIGLILVSRFIRWMLAHYHSVTVALLSGLTIGALNKLWPWRNVIEYTTTGLGDRVPAYDQSILPWEYVTITGKDPQVFQAVLMMAIGIFVVVLFEKIAARLKTKI
jgi:putative membrane protein